MTSERMPPLEQGSLSPAQQASLERVTSGPRGRLLGPFAVLLRAPGLMDRVQELGAYLRYDKGLSPRLFELVVLLVARRWDQDFEWVHHRPLALEAGLTPEVVDAVAEGRRPDTADEQVTLVWEVVAQLQRSGGCEDEVYERAVQHLGEDGVLEVVVTVGYYTTLAMVLNVAGTPAEDGPGLPPRGHGVEP